MSDLDVVQRALVAPSPHLVRARLRVRARFRRECVRPPACRSARARGDATGRGIAAALDLAARYLACRGRARGSGSSTRSRCGALERLGSMFQSAPQRAELLESLVDDGQPVGEFTPADESPLACAWAGRRRALPASSCAPARARPIEARHQECASGSRRCRNVVFWPRAAAYNVVGGGARRLFRPRASLLVAMLLRADVEAVDLPDGSWPAPDCVTLLQLSSTMRRASASIRALTVADYMRVAARPAG